MQYNVLAAMHLYVCYTDGDITKTNQDISVTFA